MFFRRKVVEKIVEVEKKVYLLGEAVPVTLYERYSMQPLTGSYRLYDASEGFFLTSEAAFKNTSPTTRVRSRAMHKVGDDYILSPEVVKLDIKG